MIIEGLALGSRSSPAFSRTATLKHEAAQNHFSESFHRRMCLTICALCAAERASATRLGWVHAGGHAGCDGVHVRSLSLWMMTSACSAECTC
mmetsp:Transcript_64309/g.176491  ORF Transcript_64309/g.176491 Transcript_64309/m.176491 type:complete len:92 (+) Transcript_64309:489-764(+)